MNATMGLDQSNAYRFKTARRVAATCSFVDGVRWFVASRGRQERPIDVTLLGRPVLLRTNTPDFRVARRCFAGEYQGVIKQIKSTVHRLIIDAGGYIGTAAIVLAEAYPDAQIVTLEPSSENFAILAHNVARYSNIEALNMALAPRSERLMLHDRSTGQWGYTIVDKAIGSGAPAPIEEVNTITVADLLRRYGCHGIDILKLDIEGSEKALFEGDIDWVRHTRAICVELHDRIVPGCTEAFEAATMGRRNTQMKGEKILSVWRKAGSP